MSNLLFLTAQYSNAVMVAVLPQLSDFAGKLHLPVDLPITTNSVQRCVCHSDKTNPGGYFVLTNGYQFWYNHGYVEGFAPQHSYYRIENSDELAHYYGQLNIIADEAIKTARDGLVKLGYRLEDIYADQTPVVISPPKFDNHVVPIYRIEWHSPLETSALNLAIQVEVDGERNCIQSMWLASRCFFRAPPEVTTPTSSADIDSEELNFQSNRLVAIALPRINRFASMLALPLKLPVSGLAVDNIDPISETFARIRLTNHFRFWYAQGEITAFSSPDAIFLNDPSPAQLPLNAYTGQWKLTVPQSAQLVRNALKALGYSTNDLPLEREPVVSTPTKVGNIVVPRYLLDWLHEDHRVSAEVDADHGVLKSLSVPWIRPANNYDK